jgi:hypothetical protein
MDVVERETGNCSGTGVMCDDGTEEGSITVEDAIDIKEEFSIKVEDAIDLKDEIPQAITFKIIKTEQEVRLWCVCVCVCVGGRLCFHAVYGPKKETAKLHLTVYCFLLYCGCHITFDIWIAI